MCDLEMKEKRLYRTLQQLRLKTDMDLVNRDLSSNKPAYVAPGAFALTARVKNFFVDNNTRTLTERKQGIQCEINRYTACGETLQCESPYLDRCVTELFGPAQYSLEKDIFSVRVAFDGDYKYAYEKQGLEAVSRILYGETAEIFNVKDLFFGLYQKIALKSESSTQNMLVRGASFLVSCFATAGLDILVEAISGKLAYSGLDFYNKKRLVKELKESSVESLTYQLAQTCYTVHFYKFRLQDQTRAKQLIKELLLFLNDFRQSICESLFVDDLDVEENQKKIKLLHNVDNVLIQFSQKKTGGKV